MSKQMYIRCKKCGHCEEVNKKLFAKIIGGVITGFGYWAWVTYLFAGTGFAMPLCIAIMAGGVAMVAFSEQIVGWINKKYPCPKCGSKVWEIKTHDELLQEKEINIKNETIMQQNRMMSEKIEELRNSVDTLIQNKENGKSNERLDVNQLKDAFHEGIKSAKTEIDIYVPNLGRSVFETEEFKQEIFEALKRGCTVKIRCGYADRDDEEKIQKLKNIINKFVSDQRFSTYDENRQLRFKIDDSHAKLFMIDEEYYILASMNFLSYSGDDMIYNGKLRHRWEELGEKSEDIDNLLAYRGKYFSF